MEYFVVGAIQNTHGLKGDLKIKNLSDFERFKKGSRLFINQRNEYIEVVVQNAKKLDDIYHVRFVGLEDINLVEKYKGCLIYIEKDDMGELGEDEYYFHDLIGKHIINQDNVQRGIVEGIREVPQGHLLVVNVMSKNKLIPFRKEFIRDVLEDKIIINEIEGLL